MDKKDTNSFEAIADNELDKVNGGQNETERITLSQLETKIKEVIGYIPEPIYNSIMEAIEKYGQKAANSLIERMSLEDKTKKNLIKLIDWYFTKKED